MDKKSLMRRMIWAAVMAAALFLVLMYAVGYRVDSLAWTQEIYRYNALLKKFCIASAVGAAVMFIIYMGFGKYKVSLLICACILVINLGMLGYAWAIQPEWEKIAIEQMQELEQEEKTCMNDYIL